MNDTLQEFLDADDEGRCELAKQAIRSFVMSHGVTLLSPYAVHIESAPGECFIIPDDPAYMPFVDKAVERLFQLSGPGITEEKTAHCKAYHPLSMEWKPPTPFEIPDALCVNVERFLEPEQYENLYHAAQEMFPRQAILDSVEKFYKKRGSYLSTDVTSHRAGACIWHAKPYEPGKPVVLLRTVPRDESWAAMRELYQLLKAHFPPEAVTLQDCDVELEGKNKIAMAFAKRYRGMFDALHLELDGRYFADPVQLKKLGKVIDSYVYKPEPERKQSRER